MKRHNDADLDKDSVWALLDRAPLRTASPRFADDVVRAARLMAPEKPWWQRTPTLALGSLGAAAAAIAMMLYSPQPVINPGIGGMAQAHTNFGDLQEIADAETLAFASDHLDQLSDSELVSLVGF